MILIIVISITTTIILKA